MISYWHQPPFLNQRSFWWWGVWLFTKSSGWACATENSHLQNGCVWDRRPKSGPCITRQEKCQCFHYSPLVRLKELICVRQLSKTFRILGYLCNCLTHSGFCQCNLECQACLLGKGALGTETRPCNHSQEGEWSASAKAPLRGSDHEVDTRLPIYRGGDWGSERLCELIKVTQQGRDGPVVSPRFARPQGRCSVHYSQLTAVSQYHLFPFPPTSYSFWGTASWISF